MKQHMYICIPNFFMNADGTLLINKETSKVKKMKTPKQNINSAHVSGQLLVTGSIPCAYTYRNTLTRIFQKV